MELTIGLHDLNQLVAPVAVCAGRDDGLPVINAVLLEARGGYLIASATDRFALAMNRHPIDVKQFRALLPLSSLAAITRTFKAGRGLSPMLSLTVTATGLRVKAAGELVGVESAEIVVPLELGNFPALHELIRTAINSDAVPMPDGCGLDFEFVARFKSAQPRHSGLHVRLIHPGTHPQLMVWHDDFIAILMSRKGEPISLDSWLSILPETKGKAA